MPTTTDSSNATGDTTVIDSNPQVLTPMPSIGTPSIISIPPQISTTIVWVAVGFALGVWLMASRSKKAMN